MLTVFLAILAIALAATVFFFAYGRAETWTLLFGDPDLGTYVRSETARSAHSNDALLCTAGLCEGVAVDSVLPDFPGPPESLIGEIDAAMRASGEIFRRVDDGSDPTRIRFVTFTPLMRFPDTASFEAVPLENGRVGLVAYGRAQLGHSDQGVNRRRLRRIVSALKS